MYLPKNPMAPFAGCKRNMDNNFGQVDIILSNIIAIIPMKSANNKEFSGNQASFNILNVVPSTNLAYL